MQQHERINKTDLMQAARGRWEEILAVLAPQLQAAMDRKGRHVPCPIHGGKDGFRVFRDVDETGGSICNTCGIHADGLSTLIWANGWSFSLALKAVADYLHAGNTFAKPARVIALKKPTKSLSETGERLRQSLNRVWSESFDVLAKEAEPARRYLAGRGLSLTPPDVLRFHSSLPYFDGDKMLGKFPALLAMLTSSTGQAITLHRTYLTPDGSKAPVESVKKLMAYPKDRKIVGGAIRLDTAASEVLAVTEGLETALAVREASEMPVWCAVNAYLLGHFVPPDAIRKVLVFADKDRPTTQHPEGHGQAAAKQLVERLWGLGIQAWAIVPAGQIPSGQKSLDWLDVLNRDGCQAFPSLQSVERAVRRVA